MNKFDYSVYDTDYVETRKSNKTPIKEVPKKKQAFDYSIYDQSLEDENKIPEKQEEESFLSDTFRTASQIPQGILSTTTPGLLGGLWEGLAHGEIYDPEEIEHIKMISEREGVPFDEEAYREAGRKALSAVPTVSNIARMTEEQTGIPLEPKTRLQKGLRFATEATRLSPEGAGFRGTNAKLPKPVLGAGVEATKEILQEAGFPEPAAELASFAILKQMPENASKLSVSKSTKPSGLTERQFEKLKTPTKVSESKIKGINEKVENEFRDIASKIIEKSPIEETYSALKNDSGFKQAAGEAFKEVESLSEQISDTISSRNIKKEMAKNISKNKHTGISPSEYDKSYRDFTIDFLKDIKNRKEFTPTDLVKQYRKNNKSLSEAYEPGLSFSKNRAKREALIDYNKSIASLIEKEFPKSEFSNLFKSSNENWSKIMDAESIDKFMDKLFDGKINFKKGESLLNKEGMKVPFQRALGKEGFKNFEQLTKDLLSTEQAHKMMKVAEKKGLYDLGKTALVYATHPVIGQVKFLKDTYNLARKSAFEMLLDKPKLSIKWDQGVRAFKKGDFQKADKLFNELENERIKGLEKFKEKSTKK